ncbi:MAG: hypothetical protein KAS40_07495, partial [Desulfobacterales bacterium]|nr:hypothetical protein [Desulfobacterales bacterium]
GASACAARATSTNIQFAIFNFQFSDKPGFPLRSNRLVRVSIQPVTLTESNCQAAKNVWL